MNNKSNKTLRKIIDEYLSEQEKRLAVSTFQSYKDALSWLICGVERNSYSFLDEKKLKLFEKKQEQGVEFEDFFGSEVFDGVVFADFLGYFLPRKICVGFESAKKICSATVHFYNWLIEKDYINNGDDDVWTAKDLRAEFKESWQEHEERIKNYII